MEVIEVCQKRRLQPLPSTCPPCAKKCTRRYVQPARVESYAPERMYCPPTNPLDADTTYHLSYLNSEPGLIQRSGPIRPRQNLDTVNAKFEDGTTNKLSYQPVWGIVRAKPIVPSRRPTLDHRGAIQSTTTARHDYVPKYAERPHIIVPCGNIRTSSGFLDAKTTASLSFMNPGRIRRQASFKPDAKYRPPGEPTSKDTTQKLSYQPFRVSRREIYPWAQKPLYKPPVWAMDANTTYSKSYMDLPAVPLKEKPIVPRPANILQSTGQFAGKTVYNESYMPCGTDYVLPIRPSNNIALSDQRMFCDTTNKLSYQPVTAEKRSPIRPSSKKMIPTGPMESETTNRHDFIPKMVPRPDVIIPSNNIRSCHEEPLESCTTAALSYMNPGRISRVPSFKPQAQYYRPTKKIEADTVNKLSYQAWALRPSKSSYSWFPKAKYEPPRNRMASDTIYNMSFPAPGFYVDDDDEPIDESSSTPCIEAAASPEK